MVRNFPTCFRFGASSANHIIGNLPNERVTSSRPFLVTGIDYMGPVSLKDRVTRNPKVLKACICLFVCFSICAIHLALVGDLSNNAFLAALKRFFARRGLSSDIFSDHGSNFIGAKNEI